MGVHDIYGDISIKLQRERASARRERSDAEAFHAHVMQMESYHGRLRLGFVVVVRIQKYDRFLHFLLSFRKPTDSPR